jgi:serine/threonine protein kinase
MGHSSNVVELDDTLAASDVTPLLAVSLSSELKRTLVERPRSTIEPSEPSEPNSQHPTLPGRTGDGLGAPVPTGTTDGVPGFVVRRTLGEGGMGIVRAAEQLSVGRQVAVKTVRGELANDPRVALRLLREAWLAGRVEHPNVVPIYDVGVDGAGRPHIAMRLVDGTPWDELLGDPALVRTRYGTTDVLEWHLRVLVQVTHAVSRAHAKGIVHRDIKPENVMIGEFGEVYLLDWGIAVSLVADPEGRLPLARDAKETAGTPCYMAPEMLGGPKPLIDERTDVYLLGATLYEIVTGKPPHTGKVFAELVKSILESTPTFGPEVPRDLAAICERAMQRAREDRYTSAQEVRTAISDFLTHRGSNALAEEASARKAELFACLEGAPDAIDRHARSVRCVRGRTLRFPAGAEAVASERRRA